MCRVIKGNLIKCIALLIFSLFICITFPVGIKSIKCIDVINTPQNNEIIPDFGFLSLSGTWETKSPSSIDRGFLSSEVSKDKIYLFCYWDSDISIAYNTSTDTWSDISQIKTQRSIFGIASLNNKIYCFGGQKPYPSAGTTDVNEVYYPNNDSWQSLSPVPYKGLRYCAIAVNDAIYSFSGYPFSSMMVYYPTNDTWVVVDSINYEYQSPCIAAYKNKIYLFGGSLVNTDYNVTYEYDIINGTFISKNPMPTPRSQAKAHLINGKIYVIGGRSNGLYSTVNDVYDPITDTWSQSAPMPTSRAAYSGGVVNNEAYLIGGYNPGKNCDVNEVFNPDGNAVVPAYPSNFAAIPGDLYVNLSWQKPLDLGGSEITNYRIYRRTANTTTTILNQTANVLLCQDRDVNNFETYYYSITAVNAAGESPHSPETIAKPVPKTGLLLHSFPSSIDSVTQTFLEYLPTNYINTHKWPLILFLHGASGTMYQYPNNTQVTSICEDRGYISAFANGRNAYTNYFNSIDYGPGENDTLDIISYLKTIREIDDSRIYLVGRSMGGGSAWSLAARNPSIFAATAPHVGVTDWIEYYKYSQTYGNLQLTHVFGGKYDKNSSVLSQYKMDSVRFLIENMMNIPVFVTHGDNDTNVPNNVTTWPYMNAYHMIDNASYSDGNGHTPTIHELAARFPGKYTEQHMWAYGRNHSYYPDFNQIFDFFDKYQKNMSVNQVFYKTYDAVHTSAYWVDIRINKPLQDSPGYINATYETSNQTIMVETLNATRIGINLNYLPFDIANPINIKTWLAVGGQTNASMVIWGSFFKYGPNNAEVIMDYSELQEGKDFSVYNDRIVINNFTMNGWHTFTILPKTPINEIIFVCFSLALILIILVFLRK